ncbi:MAG TPA: hypothetical protein DD979_10620 [Gammaproteobacteria bacterium]|nr:hypothetical protein [Gammaproteobacteria bacterium]
MKNNPPLKAIRTFEAAARLSNFREAADELSVTASAVSHQIRQLEDYLQKTLFNRSDRRVSLTSAGEYYFREVSQALTCIDQATDKLRDLQSTRVLKISAAVCLTLADAAFVGVLQRAP